MHDNVFRHVKTTCEPVHEILVCITHSLSHSLYMYEQLSSGGKTPNFWLSLHLYFFFLCMSSEGSDEPATFAQARLSIHSLHMH